jgi:hypothetical protein
MSGGSVSSRDASSFDLLIEEEIAAFFAESFGSPLLF